MRRDPVAGVDQQNTQDYGPSGRDDGYEREWRVAIRRPGVDGLGVSFKGDAYDERLARRYFELDVPAYAKDEPNATVLLQSRLVQEWQDEPHPSASESSLSAEPEHPEGAPNPEGGHYAE